jgi:hypothetical protein
MHFFLLFIPIVLKLAAACGRMWTVEGGAKIAVEKDSLL